MESDNKGGGVMNSYTEDGKLRWIRSNYPDKFYDKFFFDDDERIFLIRDEAESLGDAMTTHQNLGLNWDGYKTVAGLRSAITRLVNGGHDIYECFTALGWTRYYDGHKQTFHYKFNGERKNVKLVKFRNTAMTYRSQKWFEPDFDTAVYLNESLYKG